MIKTVKIFIFVVTLILLNALQNFAQSSEECKIPEFDNCIGLEQLILKNVSGQVNYYFEDKVTKKENYLFVSDACISIYTKDRKLVISSKTDENGHFQFNKLKDGNYWIVIRDRENFLTPAIIEIKVSHKAQDKKISVHMTILAIDSCSYGELQ